MNDAAILSSIKDTGLYAVRSASDMPNGNEAAVMEVLNFSPANGNYCIQRVVYISDINTIYQRVVHQESGVGNWVKYSSDSIKPVSIITYNGWDAHRIQAYQHGNIVTVAGQLSRSEIINETSDNTLVSKISVSHNSNDHVIVPAICYIDGVFLPSVLWVVKGGYLYVRGQDMSKIKDAYINVTFTVS